MRAGTYVEAAGRSSRLARHGAASPSLVDGEGSSTRVWTISGRHARRSATSPPRASFLSAYVTRAGAKYTRSVSRAGAQMLARQRRTYVVRTCAALPASSTLRCGGATAAHGLRIPLHLHARGIDHRAIDDDDVDAGGQGVAEQHDRGVERRRCRDRALGCRRGGRRRERWRPPSVAPSGRKASTTASAATTPTRRRATMDASRPARVLTRRSPASFVAARSTRGTRRGCPSARPR